MEIIISVILSFMTSSIYFHIIAFKLFKMSSIREFLLGLSRTTKEYLLRLLIILLILIGISIIAALTNHSLYEAGPSIYENYLVKYIQRYSIDQDHYNRFVFYLSQDGILFKGKQLNEQFYDEVRSFANISEPEFQELYHTVTSLAKAKKYLQIAQFEDNYYYDWSEFMSPVKDMFDNDVSHIFAATAVMEFEVNKKLVLRYRQDKLSYDLKQNFVTLSEQEVIDCCPDCLAHRQPKYVYDHLKEYGISPDDKYGYVSSIFNTGPFQCRTKSTQKPYRLKGYDEIMSCAQLAKQLEFGPVVVSVDSRNWRSYEGGIFDSCSSGIKRNHFAVVVGRGIGYWKVRNSWGPRWGEHGYIRIKSGSSCGVCSKGTFIQIE